MSKIGVVGAICGYDFILAKALVRNGADTVVFRPRPKNRAPGERNFSPECSPAGELEKENIYYFRSSWDFFRRARKCSLIVDINLGLISSLRYNYFLRFLSSFPPVINFTTGADITELIAQKKPLSYLYRLHLKTSSLTWAAPYPHAVKNLVRYRIFNTVFMRYPCYIAPEKPTPFKSGEEITFFHPSHLDWKVNDPGAHRNTAKGNDRFLRAFIRAVRGGLKAKCVILYRGSDREEAKKLIHEAGMEDYFIWKGHLTREELFREYEEADVVVDQFDIGGLGMISLEAMSAGRPVLIYIHEDSARLLYGEDLPPVLNCCSEEEIYAQIMHCGDRQYLDRRGRESREWVLRNHHWSTCLEKFFFYYSLFTREVLRKDASVGDSGLTL